MRYYLLHLLYFMCSDPISSAKSFTAETLADGTLYSDQVARRIGDLITIHVSENTTVTESHKTDTSRDNDLNFAVEPYCPVQAVRVSSEATTGTLPPGLDITSGKEFAGEGSYQASGAVSARITGRVIDIMIMVTCSLRVGAKSPQNDSKTILIGVVEPQILAGGNVVSSEKIHNFMVSIEGEGPLTRSQQEGWLARLMNVVWPF